MWINILGTHSEMTPAFSYSYANLKAYWRKGLRNGNWGKLSFLDKALYRAALWYLKHHRKIVKASLAEKLSALVQKLKVTRGMRIFKRGFEKALEMLEKGEEKGVFVWASQLKNLAERPGLHLLARAWNRAVEGGEVRIGLRGCCRQQRSSSSGMENGDAPKNWMRYHA